jgi:hypothetical protein
MMTIKHVPTHQNRDERTCGSQLLPNHQRRRRNHTFTLNRSMAWVEMLVLLIVAFLCTTQPGANAGTSTTVAHRRLRSLENRFVDWNTNKQTIRGASEKEARSAYHSTIPSFSSSVSLNRSLVEWKNSDGTYYWYFWLTIGLSILLCLCCMCGGALFCPQGGRM